MSEVDPVPDPDLEDFKSREARRPGCVAGIAGFLVFIILLVAIALLAQNVVYALPVAIAGGIGAGKFAHKLKLRWQERRLKP